MRSEKLMKITVVFDEEVKTANPFYSNDDWVGL